MHMLLRGEAKRNRDDYVDIALSESSPGMYLTSKAFRFSQRSTQVSASSLRRTSTQRFTTLMERFRRLRPTHLKLSRRKKRPSVFWSNPSSASRIPSKRSSVASGFGTLLVDPKFSGVVLMLH